MGFAALYPSYAGRWGAATTTASIAQVAPEPDSGSAQRPGEAAVAAPIATTLKADRYLALRDATG